MKRAATLDPQDELALSSVQAHALFPGRSTLYVSEVAKALCITGQQVIDLSVFGDLMGVRIGASRGGAADSAAMTQDERQGTPRAHWRVPVSAFDAFIAARKSR